MKEVEMSANLKDPFGPSCCDGGSSSESYESARPCGCDPGANHVCEQHRKLRGEETKRMAERIESEGSSPNSKVMTKFESGATRNDSGNKFDYEGFINPEVLHEFGRYMHDHRKQRDGSLRDSDNWQKGIPFRAYIKSLVRHVIDLWRMERGFSVINPDTNQPHTREELCCAIMFNSMGYLKELLSPSEINR